MAVVQWDVPHNLKHLQCLNDLHGGPDSSGMKTEQKTDLAGACARQVVPYTNNTCVWESSLLQISLML